MSMELTREERIQRIQAAKKAHRVGGIISAIIGVSIGSVLVLFVLGWSPSVSARDLLTMFGTVIITALILLLMQARLWNDRHIEPYKQAARRAEQERDAALSREEVAVRTARDIVEHVRATAINADPALGALYFEALLNALGERAASYRQAERQAEGYKALAEKRAAQQERFLSALVLALKGEEFAGHLSPDEAPLIEAATRARLQAREAREAATLRRELSAKSTRLIEVEAKVAAYERRMSDALTQANKAEERAAQAQVALAAARAESTRYELVEWSVLFDTCKKGSDDNPKQQHLAQSWRTIIEQRARADGMYLVYDRQSGADYPAEVESNEELALVSDVG